MSATLVVRYHGTAYPKLATGPAQSARVPAVTLVTPPRIKPQALPMTPGRTPDVLHGQFTPRQGRACGPFRVDGWGDPIATLAQGASPPSSTPGQGESELSNDLLIGAQLLERAATGVPRERRQPWWTPPRPCGAG